MDYVFRVLGFGKIRAPALRSLCEGSYNDCYDFLFGFIIEAPEFGKLPLFCCRICVVGAVWSSSFGFQPLFLQVRIAVPLRNFEF